MYGVELETLKAETPKFEKAATAYFAGEITRAEYKGTAGRFGSAAQKGSRVAMLRLRLTAGRLTKKKLAFIVGSMEKYGIDSAHFTTCQNIQLHDVSTAEALYGICESAMDAGIITMGTSGDNPRNVMCSPLSGVEKGEYFDVLPYAEATAEYMLNILHFPKMPRKYKCAFSNSPKNETHATFRDMGFAARPDGTFDVYTAGGIGPNPRKGVLCAEGVSPTKILYYVKALYDAFCAYGNYENRARARMRYMQETLGGADAYRKAYLEKLDRVMAEEQLDLPELKATPIAKRGEDRAISGARITEQKQPGLYAVEWSPTGGFFNREQLTKLYDAIKEIDGAEVRVTPFESAYAINLTASEAERVMASTPDTASTLFETSLSCVGAARCQVGLRDSQGLLRACVAAVREAGIPDGALPRICVSGCPSSCTNQQASALGFRGWTKKVDGKTLPAFMIDYDGCERQGREVLAEEKGAILETEIPKFLVELGRAVADSGLNYARWREANPGALEAIVAPYIE